MAPDPKQPAPSAADPLAQSHPERVSETFRRAYRQLIRQLRRKAPRDVAEEIATESFTEVLGERYASISRLLAYVRKAADNKLANHYRHKEVLQRTHVLLKAEANEAVASPESDVLKQQREYALGHALDSLPIPYRTVLILRYFHECSDKEIAAYFAAEGNPITERTVQRYLSEGYERLRQALNASEEPKEERTE